MPKYNIYISGGYFIKLLITACLVQISCLVRAFVGQVLDFPLSPLALMAAGVPRRIKSLF